MTCMGFIALSVFLTIILPLLLGFKVHAYLELLMRFLEILVPSRTCVSFNI